MIKKEVKIGKFKKRKTCRFCKSRKLIKFLDFGHMPHAGNYLKPKEVGKEYYYPLRIFFCKNCGLIQNLDIISSETLFKNYHYLSSVSLTKHFQEYAKEVKKKFLNKNSFIVEIGSNDGVLLLPLSKMGFKVLGVDPAVNVGRIAKKKDLDIIVDYFGVKVADNIVKKNGKADLILANNVLAHIDDMNNVFKGIGKLLKDDGVLIFEVHYFPDLLKRLQYDFFYGEHLSYYNVSTLITFLNKYNLEIFDVKKMPIHSGSIRVYAKFKGNNRLKTKAGVLKLVKYEDDLDRVDEKILENFNLKIDKHRSDIKKLLMDIKKGGSRIVGYGAGGRANTFLCSCDVNNDLLDYIVDESPERQGKFTPGTHIPIVSPEIFRKDKVKYVLLLAWNYKKEIIKKEQAFAKNGGKFIVSFPKIHLVH
ncbi:MAG: class I SAM-dependent methyltransferase [Candidatus Woesebacteria bacterium]|nr:MAG: class I SAM-dependent methyltransferase [Candidatus Woesebacteria bacterium]